MRGYTLRWFFVILLILAVIGAFIVGIRGLRFDTDILASLPQNDSVLADARYVIMNHPIQDRVVVDVGQVGGDRDILVKGAGLVELRMRESGLFKDVGLHKIGQQIPELLRHIVDHLPILFSSEELESKIKPLLTPEKIKQTMNDHFSSLHHLSYSGDSIHNYLELSKLSPEYTGI